MRFTTCLFLSASLCAGLAQTNLTFQDCQAGDKVKVNCDHPLLVLGHATLLDVGSNTVTVCTDLDRFVLKKNEVTLFPLASQPRTPDILSPGATPEAVTEPNLSNLALAGSRPAQTSPSATIPQTMESIRASVIDPYKMEAYREPKMVNGKWELVIDPNSTNGQAKYDKANAYYRTTMKGVMDGSVTVADLVKTAREELKQIDELKSQGVDVSMYNQKIETLRDFVRRADAGEKIDFGSPIQ